MAITENKSSGWNVNPKQLIGLGVVLAIIVVAVATDSLVIGYVGMTLVLSAFFLVVAFDVGLDRRERGRAEAATAPAASTAGRPKGRSTREL